MTEGQDTLKNRSAQSETQEKSFKNHLLAMPDGGEDNDARQEARRDEVKALATMRGMDLVDEEVMSGAWPEWFSG
jgi:hypothetical protein